MIDWRNGLTWVPILVFTLFLVISFVIGLAGGYKRALFWTGGNLVLWLIGLLVCTFAGDAITNSIAQLIKDKVTAEQIQKMSVQEIADAIKIYIGLILYFVIALIGNLIVLLPLYFCGFVRWARIGKYDPRSKKYDAYVAKYDTKKPAKADKLRARKSSLKMGSKAYFWMSRGIAIPASVVLAAPLTATMTQLAFGATVQTSQIYTEGTEASSLKGMFDFTNWITSNIGKNYIGELGKNTSSIISGANLALKDGANLQEVFTKLEDCLNAVSDIGDSVSKETMDNDIKPDFVAYSDYIKLHADELEPYIYDLSLSNQVINAVEAVLDAIMPSVDPGKKMTEKKFANVRVFVNGMLTGGIINTEEGNDKVDSYPLDWYQNDNVNKIQRLKLPENVFLIIAGALEKIMFDTTEPWKDVNPSDAAKSVASLFFECNDVQDGKLNNLDIIISPNQTIIDMDEKEPIFDRVPSMGDVIWAIADKLEPKWEGDAKKKLVESLYTQIGNIISFNQNTGIINEIKKNSSGGQPRDQWGNASNPYIVPVDMFYTIDLDENNYDQYLTISVDETQYTATVTQKAPIKCKKTDFLTIQSYEGYEPLWWSFVPFFDPIYAIPDFKVKVTPIVDTEAQGTSDHLDKFLETNWYKSIYQEDYRDYCSLFTGANDTIIQSDNALVNLSELCDTQTQKPLENVYKLQFEFFKDGKSIGSQYKYFKLSSFLTYKYTPSL